MLGWLYMLAQSETGRRRGWSDGVTGWQASSTCQGLSYPQYRLNPNPRIFTNPLESVCLQDFEIRNNTIYHAPFLRYSTAKEVENHPTLVWAPIEGRTRSNFVAKLIMLNVEPFCYFLVKTAWCCFSRFVTMHLHHRRTDNIQTDDRQHNDIAKLCNAVATIGCCKIDCILIWHHNKPSSESCWSYS